jgi:hypothetical protein
MNSRFLVVTITLAWSGFAGVQARDRADNGKPAWPGVFIELEMFGVRYLSPAVSADDKVYSQTARYDWLGGRYEVLEITLLCDPAIKQRYSAENLKKEKIVPSELEINKKKAFEWMFEVDPGKIDALSRRLVVVLADDKAIIINQHGSGLTLEEVARKFDFGKVEKALSAPPKKSEKSDTPP